MNTSNAAVQTSKAEAQKGFSLIELLVVVAIIGVLAAAGIVGYQSYLDNVKKDTHHNNAIAIEKAASIALIATKSDLSGSVAACKLDTAALTGSNDSARLCIKGILDAGGGIAKWKSPLDTTLEGDTYIVASTQAVGTYDCGSGNSAHKNVIAVAWEDTGAATDGKGKIHLNACDSGKPARILVLD